MVPWTDLAILTAIFWAAGAVYLGLLGAVLWGVERVWGLRPAFRLFPVVAGALFLTAIGLGVFEGVANYYRSDPPGSGYQCQLPGLLTYHAMARGGPSQNSRTRVWWAHP